MAKNFDIGQTVYFWDLAKSKVAPANYRGQINHAACIVVDGYQFSIPLYDVYGTPEEVKPIAI